MLSVPHAHANPWQALLSLLSMQHALQATTLSKAVLQVTTAWQPFRHMPSWEMQLSMIWCYHFNAQLQHLGSTVCLADETSSTMIT